MQKTRSNLHSYTYSCAQRKIRVSTQMHTKIHHHISGEPQRVTEAGERTQCVCAFTPICQLISISCIKSDELLLMARKAVGCLVTFWLYALHASNRPNIDTPTQTRKRTENQSLHSSLSLSCVVWPNESALIKFYGIFELHKSNSVPVHIITKTLTTTTTMKKEMKISFYISC